MKLLAFCQGEFIKSLASILMHQLNSFVNCHTSCRRDFRHQFQLLGKVRSLVSTATVMALTATCNSVNITAIKQELSTDNCETILWSFDRSNIFLSTTALPLKK